MTRSNRAPDGPTGPGEAAPVRDLAYSYLTRMNLMAWLVHHQENIVYRQTYWMGHRILKNPLDCWIYQEILWDVRPEIVVEIGSLDGGSTLFFCHVLDLLGGGEVISVDVDRSPYAAQHPRLTDITGDSSEPAIVSQVGQRCAGRTALVVHDSNHNRDAVLRDLRLYSPFVSIGSYFIVEDGIMDVIDPGVSAALGATKPGPLAAVR